MFEYIHIDSDVEVALGKPAEPLPDDLSRQLYALALNLKGIQDVQIWMTYVEEIIDPPEIVVWIRVDPDGDHDRINQELSAALAEIIPTDRMLKIWIIPGQPNPWK